MDRAISKKFYCFKHTSEEVCKIDSHHDALEKQLYCQECTKSLSSDDHQIKNLQGFHEFLNGIHKKMLKGYDLHIEPQSELPPYIASLLENCDLFSKKFNAFFDLEEKKLHDNFKSLQDSMLNAVETMKMDALSCLSKQKKVIASQYEEFKRLVSFFYHGDVDALVLSRTSLSDLITRLDSTLDFEILCKLLKDRSSEISSMRKGSNSDLVFKRNSLEVFARKMSQFGEQQDISFTLNEKFPVLIKELSLEIEDKLHSCVAFERSNIQIKYPFETSSTSEQTSPYLRKSTHKRTRSGSEFFMNSFTASIRNNHDYYKSFTTTEETGQQSVDSCILKTTENKQQLLDIIKSGTTTPRLKLIYRASKMGYNTESLAKRCGWQSPVVILAVSNANKIFGAYSEFPLEADGSSEDVELTDKSTFLFSVSKNEKYSPSITKSSSPPPRLSSEKDIVFGKGDLRISKNFSQQPSTSALGKIYHESSKSSFSPALKPNTICLGGVQRFLIQELEVFLVQSEDLSATSKTTDKTTFHKLFDKQIEGPKLMKQKSSLCYISEPCDTELLTTNC